MSWIYEQPVQIVFGNGTRHKLDQFIGQAERPLVIASASIAKTQVLEEIKAKFPKANVFVDVSANPDVEEVNRCSALIQEQNNTSIIAVGGGSVIDLAKAASTVVPDIRKYHGTGETVPKAKLPVIALPTTAGTGSEVTAVSVLTDRKREKKLPIASSHFYPKVAIIDPELLYTLPKEVTASSGIDVLCHAVEGYWSKNRQSICSSLAIKAIRLIFEYLPIAFEQPSDPEAREKTAEASLLAGLAFNLPKTTGSHACSFPLTNRYGIPHGEACAMTLDYFLEINRDESVVQELVQELHLKDVDELLKKIRNLKESVGLTRGLKEFHLSRNDILDLVMLSHHPNLKNNPVSVTDEMLEDMFTKLAEY